ncbi:thiosulfate sulfurtransferase [Andreprevotia lacus DSM 23236]|jgi:rhodanese-related sulfurtransferase|uniref:Thiosulfate sulfurtransferase n=1 Tax=Andreprevotia lacus DSM 23236 TaxID=1121001 RepID=A0A1W1X3M7_9NEIS|nr:rhodanese-like domain-containing protein [Andreprevotia lacus]SMC18021.1 thiosulfate sulfurtransferase [Andreprevotia lacus DSM 23236]
MSQINAILQTAQQRAQAQQLPYSGALTPAEAHAVLQALPQARLVDVRSQAEWQFVGTVPGSAQIEWAHFPGMQPNPHFADQLKQQVDPQSVVLFLCRSGARSHNAAALAAQLGYGEAYNILEGFEGDKNADQHRNTVNGWKAAGLPWVQG